MLENIKGIVFDMDGTLIDSLMIWNVIWEEFGKRFSYSKGLSIAAEDDRAVRTMTLKDAMYYVHSRYSLGKSGDELLDAANEIMFDFYSNRVKLKKGVSEFLEYCYGKGIKMCIASATDVKLIKVAVEHCNIGKYFFEILSCADLGKGKDIPDIYIKALEILGTSAEETVVFEDSYIAIGTAHDIGIKTVGIYDRFNYGHDIIKKLSDVYIAEGENLQKIIKV